MRRLNLGQPAVSKTIAQLEERLGVRLLLRSTRGLTPTEAGMAYYERAKRAIEEAHEADLAARGAGSGLHGTLRICAAVTFARLHVLPFLELFLEANPELDVDIYIDVQFGVCFEEQSQERQHMQAREGHRRTDP
ncbi:LysR family transcriptional regulator [Pseudomonas sp. ABY48]|uniref:LysR family transcriptional regulator n=1 Tax=Pseudomonas sp. ABY48 TaxID=3402865 RepID=UPI003B42FAB6